MPPSPPSSLPAHPLPSGDVVRRGGSSGGGGVRGGTDEQTRRSSSFFLDGGGDDDDARSSSTGRNGLGGLFDLGLHQVDSTNPTKNVAAVGVSSATESGATSTAAGGTSAAGGTAPSATGTAAELTRNVAANLAASRAGAVGVTLPGGQSQLRADGSGIGHQEDERLLGGEGGLFIEPNPRFVVKTTTTANASSNGNDSNRKNSSSGGQKVFVNVCTHTEIDVPSKRKQLDADGKEAEGLHVPLSIGPLRSCQDKSGNDAVVVDIVLHPCSIAADEDDKRHKDGDGGVKEQTKDEGSATDAATGSLDLDSLCHLLLTCVERKHPTELRPLETQKYVRLVRRTYVNGTNDEKYRGQITEGGGGGANKALPQRVRKKTTRRPKIEEVAPTPPPPPPTTTTTTSKPPPPPTMSKKTSSSKKMKKMKGSTLSAPPVFMEVYVETTTAASSSDAAVGAENNGSSGNGVADGGHNKSGTTGATSRIVPLLEYVDSILRAFDDDSEEEDNKENDSLCDDERSSSTAEQAPKSSSKQKAPSSLLSRAHRGIVERCRSKLLAAFDDSNGKPNAKSKLLSPSQRLSEPFPFDAPSSLPSTSKTTTHNEKAIPAMEGNNEDNDDGAADATFAVSAVTSATGLVVECRLPPGTNPDDVRVDLSSWLLILSSSMTSSSEDDATSFGRTECILPFPVSTDSVQCEYDVTSSILTVKASLLLLPPPRRVDDEDGKAKASPLLSLPSSPDVGSAPWTLAEALGGGGGGGANKNGANETEEKRGGNDRPIKTPSAAEQEDDGSAAGGSNVLPAENQRLGAAVLLPSAKGDDEDAPLPEDRFHERDVVSRHMLELQEKEQEERRHNAKETSEDRGGGDVEYLDADDFRPGGKYYCHRPQLDPSSSSSKKEEEEAVLASMVDDPSADGTSDGQCHAEAAEQVVRTRTGPSMLSSTMWSNLL